MDGMSERAEACVIMTIKGRLLTMKEMVMMLTRMLTRTGMAMVVRMVTRRARMLVKTVTMVMLTC